MLPAPSEGDVFFDMEGDPLYEPGRGLEYLFGCWMPGDAEKFRAFWGTSPDDEKRAPSKSFVDFVTERRKRFPALHVYHYASYEKSALRRLAQEHRDARSGGRWPPARRGARRSLRGRSSSACDLGGRLRPKEDSSASISSAAQTEVKKGDESIVMFERWLLGGERAILEDIEAYNRDDCRSTWMLLPMAARAAARGRLGVGHRFPVPPVTGFPRARAKRRPRKANAASWSARCCERAWSPNPKKSSA